MTREIYALTKAQRRVFGEMARDFKSPVLSAPAVPAADRGSLSVARLMTVGDEYPVYNPLETRKAAIFELSRNTLQATVKFYGEDLRGLVALTVGSISAQVDCRATTEELRAALSSLRKCRVTAFPGLWEFVFDDETRELPEITCEPVITSSAVRFLGGCVVTQEGWRSTSVDGDNFSQVDVIDSIPYIEGEVKLGAMALGIRYGAALYLAGQWSCPAFSFRSV